MEDVERHKKQLEIERKETTKVKITIGASNTSLS
jgi:hypothetical protein